MGAFKAILLLLQSLPALIQAIRRGEDFFELRLELKKVDDAAKTAKETKNTAEIEELLSPGRGAGPPGAR